MAVTRKIAMSAMDGEPVLEQEIGSPININPEPVTVVKQQNIIFRMVNKKQRRFTLDGICHDVKNPKTGQYETMRLIRGAHSIWSTELVEFLKDKEYVNKNRIGAQFSDGICRVPVTDKNKLEYLRNHPSNVGKVRTGVGKFDFYEYDAAEEQRIRHEARLGRIKTIQIISEMDEQKMTKLALFLGIKPYDDEVGLPRNADGFRTELLILADTKTEIVNRYINSQEVEVAYLVRKAIMDAKIDLGGQTGNVVWAGGTGYICKIPTGRKAIEYLTELAMTNSRDGISFKEQLEAIIT